MNKFIAIFCSLVLFLTLVIGTKNSYSAFHSPSDFVLQLSLAKDEKSKNYYFDDLLGGEIDKTFLVEAKNTGTQPLYVQIEATGFLQNLSINRTLMPGEGITKLWRVSNNYISIFLCSKAVVTKTKKRFLFGLFGHNHALQTVSGAEGYVKIFHAASRPAEDRPIMLKGQ